MLPVRRSEMDEINIYGVEKFKKFFIHSRLEILIAINWWQLEELHKELSMTSWFYFLLIK